jgi:biopolymer transport protein ExbB
MFAIVPRMFRRLSILCAVAFLLTTPQICVYAQETPSTDKASVAPSPAASLNPEAVPPTETTENPYGLQALWRQSDLVAHSVLLILAFMSVGTWYLIIAKLIEQLKIARQGRAANARFWQAGSLEQGAEALAAGSPFRYLADSAIDATQKHGGLLGNIALNDWVTLRLQRAVERVQSRLQEGLAFLATVGSTAPFVGLFGTVWGIYHALTAIGIAGQASIDRVAGPVGEALIMTALGLAVAVPAVLGYNWLVRRNKAVMDTVRAFGGDLHAVVLSQTK